jgi:chemotaxis protein methyltransferase CheR
MQDSECVAFLEWALPHLGLRWRGFRRVRGQVCKRLGRRLRALGIATLADYRVHLATHADEWRALDRLCRVTISRFYRDRAVFDELAGSVLPLLAGRALDDGGGVLRCWSAGCASGEEAYTLAAVVALRLRPRFPALRLRLVATDVDAALLARARRGRYAPGSLKELPADLRAGALVRVDGDYEVRPELRDGVEFRCEDIREHQPDEPFHLVLCRNLVFTYFDEALQRRLLPRLCERIVPGGFLVLGSHESLPEPSGLVAAPGARSIFQKPAQ